MEEMPAQTPVGQSFQNQDTPLHLEQTPVKKFVNLTTWILLGLFAPITVLILLSQNSLPGDFFYPVKTGFEGVILAAASISPTTKAAFRTDLADRRFSETQQLLLARADITSLPDFVNEVQTTQDEIAKLTDTSKKAELQQQLDTKIVNYEQALRQTEVQIAAANPASNVTQSEEVPASNSQTQGSFGSTQQAGTTTVVQNIYYINPTQSPTQTTGAQTAPTEPARTTTVPGTNSSPTTAPTQAQSQPTQTPTISGSTTSTSSVTTAINNTIDQLNNIKNNPHVQVAPQAQNHIEPNHGHAETHEVATPKVEREPTSGQREGDRNVTNGRGNR